MRNEIRFYRRGRPVVSSAFAPTTTLLDHLRLQERATGTKEGCAEGDCGACTVVLRRLHRGTITYEPVNACIFLLGQADGSEIITVEDLADGGLHPVQQAMVEHHGSQCGFCTPGFVMAMFALYHEEKPPSRADAIDAIAGNLCRCTGYRPIIDAALAACTGSASDRFALDEKDAAERLQQLDDGSDVFVGTPDRFFAAPASVDSLARLYLEHPDATLVAGATDVGLWITKELRDLPKVISLRRVQDLNRIEAGEIDIRFGATVTLQAAAPALASIDSDLGEMVRRFGARQVRNCATIGGNIANGSPVGDSPPALIALGAVLELQRGDAIRTLPLEDFFLDYKKQDREPGEFVRAVRVPRLRADEYFRCFKVSKRYDQDIAGVFCAVRLRLRNRRIAEARIAFGGMAATPKRAKLAEAACSGVSLDDASEIEAVLRSLDEDFSPIDDFRASAAYRRTVARTLVRKALAEIAGQPTATTRVFGRRQDAHAA